MLIKEAIKFICETRGCFIVKSFIRNHKKFTEQETKGEKKFKYTCGAHKKCHKYTFHSYIEFAPGSAFFLGLDTAKEVVKYAKELQIKLQNRKT